MCYFLVEMSKAFAYCLGLTIILELLFALICHIWNRQDWLLIALVNVVTNPWVVFVYAIAKEFDLENVILAPLEFAAVIAEALIYKRYSPTIKYPWYFALGANMFSLGMGYVIALIR